MDVRMAEEEGFEPPVPVSKDSRFRVGPVMATSVLLLASGLEELLEQSRGFIGKDTTYYRRFMVNVKLKGLEHRLYRSIARITRAVDKLRDAGLNDSPHTHYAGLKGNIEPGAN